eukprot:6691683-Heterocapsa_arctica.AAC.1
MVPDALVPFELLLVRVALRWDGVLLLLFGLILRIAAAAVASNAKGEKTLGPKGSLGEGPPSGNRPT